MKQSIYFLLILFFAVQNTSAQIGGNAIYNGSNNGNGYGQQSLGGVDLQLDGVSGHHFSTVLEANVMANVKASSFVAIFSITQHATTIEEADRLMDSRIQLFKRSVEQIGIQSEQFFVDPVSLVPAYAIEIENKKYSKTFNEVPDGFEMKKNVHITFTQQPLINQIISFAAKAEIYDLVKAEYVIDDLDKVLEQLREDAVQILLKKKAAIEKLGIHARFTRIGEKYGSAYPFERYQQYMAYKAGTPKSYTVNYNRNKPQQVNYNYAEKNKTIYYEKVSDKQFDKVINPVVNEPLVQVYLSLKSEYQVYDPEKELADKGYNERMRVITEKEASLRLVEKEKLIEQIGKTQPKSNK